VPEEVEELFPNKVLLYKKMRAFEQDVKSYLQAKSLNLKEDILAGNASVKRMVKIMVEVDPNSSENSWSARIEGKVQENGLDQT
jgi:hypothetical protein